MWNKSCFDFDFCQFLVLFFCFIVLFIFFSPWWFMCVSECVWELPTYLNTYTYISLFICPALSCQPNRLGKLAEQVLCDKSGCLLCCLVCFCVFTFVIYFAWSFVMLSHSSLFFQHLARFFSSSRWASASVSLFISAESCFYQLAPDHCSTAGLDTWSTHNTMSWLHELCCDSVN